ncbi:hypothetical protein [Deinococcus roseus]|uniref:Uncharacterized protein n=1 Tax=Deinococcus roseus TaxID=392414 RepID=A0ABQ2CTH4_9DEIO|nr:hypothetical protein [Deinococcus roseus]GGJ19082.1 hypothetical protein GCM10008938_01350 [Deinococcus roseus]
MTQQMDEQEWILDPEIVFRAAAFDALQARHEEEGTLPQLLKALQRLPASAVCAARQAWVLMRMGKRDIAIREIEFQQNCLLSVSMEALLRSAGQHHFSPQELQRLHQINLEPGRDSTDFEGIMRLELLKSSLAIAFLQGQGVKESLNRAYYLAQVLGTRSMIPRIFYQLMRLHCILCEYENVAVIFPQVAHSAFATKHLKWSADDVLFYAVLFGGLPVDQVGGPEVRVAYSFFLEGKPGTLRGQSQLATMMEVIELGHELFYFYHINYPYQISKQNMKHLHGMIDKIDAAYDAGLHFDVSVDYWDDIIPLLIQALAVSLKDMEEAQNRYQQLKFRSREVSAVLEMVLDFGLLQMKTHARDLQPLPAGFAQKMLDRVLLLNTRQKETLNRMCALWFPVVPFVLQGIVDLKIPDSIAEVQRNGFFLAGEKITNGKKSYPTRVIHRTLHQMDAAQRLDLDENELRQLRVHREYMQRVGATRFNIRLWSDQLRQLFLDNLLQEEKPANGGKSE